jgi:hypothetical protein
LGSGKACIPLAKYQFMSGLVLQVGITPGLGIGAPVGHWPMIASGSG